MTHLADTPHVTSACGRAFWPGSSLRQSPLPWRLRGEKLTTSVNKLYSIRINQVRYTLSREGYNGTRRLAHSNMTGLTFICGFSESAAPFALRMHRPQSPRGLQQHWLICRSLSSKCRTTKNSQQSSPSQKPMRFDARG